MLDTKEVTFVVHCGNSTAPLLEAQELDPFEKKLKHKLFDIIITGDIFILICSCIEVSNELPLDKRHAFSGDGRRESVSC